MVRFGYPSQFGSVRLEIFRRFGSVINQMHTPSDHVERRWMAVLLEGETDEKEELETRKCHEELKWTDWQMRTEKN